MLTIGIISALGLLLLSLKALGRKAIGSDIFIDVLITVTLMVCFYGTFSGMAAAMVGGLCASVVLFIMKKTMVHDKLVIKKEPVRILRTEILTNEFLLGNEVYPREKITMSKMNDFNKALKTKLENQFGKDFINDKVIIMDLDDLDDENNNPN
jgi:hypothetical protein